MRRHLAVLTVATVLLACGNGDEEPDATADDAGVEESDDDGLQEPEDTADEGDEQGDAPAPAAMPEGEPLAVTEHPLEEQGGTLDIELRAHEVGELLRVAITFIPRDIGPDRTSIATLFGSSGSGNGMSGRLIDPDNLLEYETVRDAVSHGQSTPAFEDQPTTLHFYFAAPQEPLDTFDFLLDFVVGAPDWPGFVDVDFGSS